MRTVTTQSLGRIILAGLFLFNVTRFLAGAADVSEVTRKSDGLFIVKAGKAEPMTEEVNFPKDIKVTTNGTFTVQNGKERELTTGQRLLSDGMLISPDGSIEPVQDHVAMKRGKMLLVKDGESRPVEQPITLPDGTRVLPDGRILTRTGGVRRIIDGQLFTLGGQEIAAKDTITLKDGKVIIQKDGSLMEVERGRSMMMNDGTKVLGDGTVVKRDGTKSKLTEGQIITVEGVVKRR